jgi:hypothetical protein
VLKKFTEERKKNDGESKTKMFFPDYKGFDVSSLARRAREEEEKKNN